MPKGKMQFGTKRKPQAVARKFKIGGRKTTQSALAMSDEQLENFSGRPRDKAKVRQVIDIRRKRTRKSRIIAEILKTAEGMNAAGAMDDETLDDFKELAK